MQNQFDIAVVGATGLVGGTLVELLGDAPLPLGQVVLLATEESAGKRLSVGGRHIAVRPLAGFDFSEVQIAFFAVPEAVAAEFAPQAAEAGATVIDCSGAFVADHEVPLIVPEVNPEMLADYRERGIIASPSPGAIQLALALKPLLDVAGLQHINVTLCEPVSASGREGVDELARQTARLMNGQGVEPGLYGRQIAFNTLPLVGDLLTSGASRAELRLVLETLRLLGDPALRINASAMRLPVFFGTALTVQLETVHPLDVGEAASLLAQVPALMQAEEARGYASAIPDAIGDDHVWVSRLRRDLSREHGLNLSLVTDNLRKGAALNCVQIAQLLIKDHLG